MKKSSVAIALLAAIWLSVPADASAQDPAPQAREAKAPRTAQPRSAERRVRRAGPRESPAAERPARRIEPPASSPSSPPAAQRRGTPRANPTRGNGNVGDQRGRNGNVGDQRGRNDRRAPRVAVPRRNVPVVYGSNTRRQSYRPPVYYDRWARQTYRWSPLAYAPWSLIYGSVGFSNYGYSAYGYYDPYGYGRYGNSSYGNYGSYGRYGGSTVYDTGNVRLRIRPRDATVFVDGYYAGLVDDFDGTFQSLRLEQGGHQIEVRMPGFEPLQLDIHVQPNRTITLREDLIPRP